MQGRLRNEKLTFTIDTECGHCGRPIRMGIDSDLNYRLLDPDAGPGDEVGAGASAVQASSHNPPQSIEPDKVDGSSQPCEPLIFAPLVDLHKLEPSIIDGF